MSKKSDISGQKFNRLTALESVRYDSKSHATLWKFLCDCGNEKIISQGNVISGHIKSCGCLNSEVASKRFKKHGKTGTKEYGAWSKMKGRCLNKEDGAFPHYGGRGIKVCDRWMASFQNFYEDMGDCPACKSSIGRMNNDGMYEPSNCRWESSAEQNSNYSRNIFITRKGETLTLTQWCNRLELNYGRVRQRIKKLGWTVERAFSC